MDSLEFGKKVQVGNYYILKYSKSLSKAEVKRLRSAQNIPADIQKHLQRASLPYIKVSTITDSWSIEFVIGMAMYAFFDTVHYVYDDEGNRLMFGEEKNTIEHILVQMMADTTLIGDKDYRLGKLKLQKEYLEREAAKRNEAEDAGKTEEQLRKESDEAVQEVIDRDKHAETLLDMAEHMKEEPKKEKKGSLDKKTLWHDVSEKPLPTDGVETAWILALKDDGCSIEQLVINTVDEVWENVVEDYNIQKWLYQEDLFAEKSKEGGQHER